MIILLDLNFTLVTNSHEKHSPFSRQIERETYDADLVAMLAGHDVLLVTARPEKYKAQTLASLRRKLDWLPLGCHFNVANLPPPLTKERALRQEIWPEHGRDPALYLAIDSNPKTRAMYAGHAIKAVTAADFKARKAA